MWDMNKFKRLSLIFTEVIAAFTLMLAPAVPAFAQDAQQQINAGLCTGSNLTFTEDTSASDCSTSDATERINNLIRTIVNLGDYDTLLVVVTILASLALKTPSSMP
jgi:hypothetical protein